MSKTDITEFDIVFLSYDEPNAEENWADLLRMCPWAKRVHGVKGLDAAHKAAANESETERFLTVDGDCKVDSRFFDIRLDFSQYQETTLSWAGRNHTNGLIYGNGGLKLWWKQNVLDMRTHEHPDRKEEEKVDFCWHQNYVQMNDCFSTTYINASPYQAWRAGFREGVKMSLDRGDRVDKNNFQKAIWPINYKRLLIWATVGADVENGVWTVLGARMAIEKVNLTDWDFGQISDYGWMKEYFEKAHYLYHNRPNIIAGLGQHLRKEMRIHLAELDATQSAFFKAVYDGHRRRGDQ